MKQCSECGTFSSDDTMFCAVCGKRFSDAIDISSAEIDNMENDNTDNYSGGQNVPGTTHPEVLPILQRVTLFLEDSEFDRADEYCERILDMEPTNADAYLGKLLVEFRCTTREQLKRCQVSIANSKNYAKIIRFGDGTQKSFVINAEKTIQAEILRQTEIRRITEELQKNYRRITEEATANGKQEEIAADESAFEPDWQEESDETGRIVLYQLANKRRRANLSYVRWTRRFVYDERMKM